MIAIPRTPHQLTPNVKLLQKVILAHQGKVLLLQRDAHSFSRPNCWDFPGGNSEWPTAVVEPTANLHQQDASREVFEETGIHIAPNEFTKENLIHLETFFDPQRQIFTVLLGWNIKLPAETQPPEIQLSEEHVTFSWTAPSEAKAWDFGGAKGAFLLRILDAIK